MRLYCDHPALLRSSARFDSPSVQCRHVGPRVDRTWFRTRRVYKAGPAVRRTGLKKGCVSGVQTRRARKKYVIKFKMPLVHAFAYADTHYSGFRYDRWGFIDQSSTPARIIYQKRGPARFPRVRPSRRPIPSNYQCSLCVKAFESI